MIAFVSIRTRVVKKINMRFILPRFLLSIRTAVLVLTVTTLALGSSHLNASGLEFLNEGIAAHDSYEFDKSIVMLDKAIDSGELLVVDLGLALFFRGLSKQALGQHPSAISDFNEFIAIGRIDPGAHFNKGLSYYFLETYDDAIAAYNEALSLDNEYSYAYANRGLAWHRKGELEKALVDFNKAIEITPEFPEAYSNRGDLWVDLGNNEKAIVDYKWAINTNIQNPLTYYGLGYLLYQDGNVDESIDIIQELLAIDPGFLSANFFLGNAYFALGKLDKSIASYTMEANLDPQNPDVFFNRGIVWRRLGDLDKEIADYERALTINSTHVDTLNNLAWAYATNKDINFQNNQKSLELALTAFELEPNDYQVLGTLAAAYARSNQFEEAVKLQLEVIDILKNKGDIDFTAEETRLDLYKKKTPYTE